MATTTVLLDLDGVIRFFDAEAQRAVEHHHGLAPGSIAAIAVDPDLMGPLVLGRLTRAEWVAEIGRRLGDMEAATAWADVETRLDHDLLADVDHLRASGVTVAILTNGTDTVAAELAALDLPRRFDAIFNSVDIGYAKPDRRAFAHVCAQLAVDADRVFFTDDSPSKLSGARELGMAAEPYVDLNAFRRQLQALGVSPRPEPA